MPLLVLIFGQRAGAVGCFKNKTSSMAESPVHHFTPEQKQLLANNKLELIHLRGNGAE